MTECPTRERLEHFLAGRLASADEEALCGHVEGCAPCQEALNALVGRPEGPEEDLPLPPAVSDFLNRLKQAVPTTQGAPAADVDETLGFLLPPSRPGHIGRLGHYEVLSVIGRGGMGMVLKAFDDKLHRMVALKALAPHLAGSGPARQRFIREARAAAAVSHDHVVPIYAVEADGPVPYLVMPCVEGTSLEEKIRRAGALGVEEILRIGLQTAEGLAAAHKQGLVHRDIKPANILLENGVERVKITDFGLARAVDDASLTQSGVVAGTPPFMAPEQAKGEPVDHRADLFALGSVLYMMCTGRPPFRGGSTMAVLKRVCEDTPRPIREINPNIPDRVVKIIARLHAKEPAGRWPSAARVAELLSQHLAHLEQPQSVPLPRLDAPPPPRRWWLLLSIPGVLTLAVALVLIFWHHAGDRANPPGGAAALAPGAAGAQAPGGGAAATQARSASEGTTDEGARPRPVPTAAELARLPSPFDGPRRQAIPLALLALTGGGDPALAPPELVAVLGDDRFRHAGQVLGVSYGPDGKRLAACSATWDPRQGRYLHCAVTVWDVPDGRPLRTLDGQTDAVLAVAFSPDGKRLATAGHDHTAGVWDAETGKELFALRGLTHAVRSVAYSPDGKLLATGGEDGKVTLWDAADGEPRRTFENHTGLVQHVTFSPDGARVASSASYGDSAVRVWETATGQEVVRLPCNNPNLRAAAFSPDGKRLVSVSDSALSQVWDAATGQELFTLRSHDNWVLAAAWTPDGRHILTASYDRTVRVWDAGDGRELRQCAGLNAIPLTLALSPDGKRVAVGSADGTVRFWDVATGEEVLPPDAHRGPVRGVAVSPDGRVLASAGQDHTVKLWDLAGWKAGEALPPVRTLREHADAVGSLAFSPDGTRLASAGADNTIALWDVAAGRQVRTLPGQLKGATVPAFSPDGQTLAAGQDDGRVELWDVATGRAREPLRWHAGPVRAVAFSPDGLLASAGSGDGTVRVGEVTTGRCLHVFKPASPPLGVAFSADGRAVAAVTALPAAALYLWDLDTEQPRLRRGHTGDVTALAFDPGGQRLATGGQDGTLRLWTSGGDGPESQVIGPGPFGKGIDQVAFTPDGRYLATANENGTVTVLRVPAP